MFIDANLRLSGSAFGTPDDPGDATSAGERSTNYLDLTTAPRVLGEGEPFYARFTVTEESFNSGTENATCYLQLIMQPKTGSTQTQDFTAADTNIVTATAHGLINGTRITVATSAADLPAGLAVSTNYYVISATTDTFKVSLTPGGTEVDITDAGTGTHTLTWYPEVVACSGAIAIDRLTIGSSVTIAVNPLPQSPDFPMHRYLYAFWLPSATLTAGKCFVDLIHGDQQGKRHHATAISVT